MASSNDLTDDRVKPGMDAEEHARQAGLTYVSDSEPGLRRKRWGRGFTYLDAEGGHVTDEAIRRRIEDLVIPPAWTDEWICSDPDGHLQATGRDDQERKQYIYHPEWERIRNEAKFARSLAFGAALPAIRERAERDLRKKGLPFEKVLGAVVFLLDRTLIRIGNRTYAAENGSFGLTTLRDRHVDFADSCCTFQFKGKRGKEHAITVEDPRLARIVRRCRDIPGYDLFQYYDERSGKDRIEASDVNAYLKETTGRDFSAKDFRTWGATVQAAVFLNEQPVPESEKEADKQVVEMVRHVAERLGNTVSVCRTYYIHPEVPRSYIEQTFRDRFEVGLTLPAHPHLDREERAILHFFDVAL